MKPAMVVTDLGDGRFEVTQLGHTPRTLQAECVQKAMQEFIDRNKPKDTVWPTVDTVYTFREITKLKLHLKPRFLVDFGASFVKLNLDHLSFKDVMDEVEGFGEIKWTYVGLGVPTFRCSDPNILRHCESFPSGKSHRLSFISLLAFPRDSGE